MPTFAMCHRSQYRWTAGLAAHRGFTLLEMLVVFAIAALIMSVTPFAFEKMRSSIQYRDSVRAIQSDLRLARETALLEGVTTRFGINLRNKNYGISGRTSHVIPDSVAVRAVVADIDEGTGQDLSIYFMAAGGSTGGSVEVIRPNGEGVRLRVDWLSGRVSQEALLQ